MAEIPNEIYKQLKLGERKPLTMETTPVIEEHQTAIKLPQKIMAELDLKKGDKIVLEMKNPTRLWLTVVKAKK
jgi:hypothetical protein